MYLEQLKQMKQSANYDRCILDEIAAKMEESIGADEMWKTLVVAFSTDELLENLEYIAKENDL